MSVCRKRSWARVAAPVLASTLAACASPDAGRGSHDDDAAISGIARFTGPIDARSVDRFIARYDDAVVERVVVDSGGGDVVAGIRLANWIVDRRADVEVENVCASSCANYLFAAGRRKIIDERSIVLWHGSILQKDFRERGAQCDRHGSEPRDAGIDIEARHTTDPEIVYCAFYRDAVEAQRAFFARVGVDEYVTRMGQEPRDFRSIWTVPVDVMARLGLVGVEAPADYASPAFMSHWNRFDDAPPGYADEWTRTENPEPILSLRFDADGCVVDVTKRLVSSSRASSPAADSSRSTSGCP